MTRRAERFPRRERGIVVLLMLVMGALVGLLFFTGVLGSGPTPSERDLITRNALAKAKSALIDYAVTYMDTHPNMPPGFLPCPEVDGSLREGSPPLGGCNNVGENAMGRLPWYSLGIAPLRDGYNECLWYAVSGNYKNNPAPFLLNWNTNGTLRAFLAIPGVGTPPALDNNVLERAVAVIIAPGPAFGNQVRSAAGVAPTTDQCGGNRAANNYLEASNGVNNAAMATIGEASFISGLPTATFNDRVITITPAEIWTAIMSRADFNARLQDLTRAVAECIANYPQTGATGLANDLRLPWASSPGNFEREPTYYNDSSHPLAGRAPYSVNDSNVQVGRNTWGSTVLMGPNGITTGKCPASWTPRVDGWWDHWRDHVFYAVSRNFAPDGQAPNTGCTPASNCITVNGLGPYAAVVMFAGPILGGLTPAQTRFQDSLKSNLASYLEEGNQSTNSTGNNNYQTASASAQPFNDAFVYCIAPSGGLLVATPCP